MRYLSKLWRFFATAFCFAVFGIGGMFIALFWLPLYRIKHRDEASRKKACRYAVHLTFKGFIYLMYWVGVAKVTTSGIEKLNKLKGNIIIANHPSLIDVVVLISLIRNADCVVKQSLWQNIFTRGVLRNTGYISNADPQGLIDDCQISLQQGSNLIIFPEGTRTRPGSPLTFQRGAANLALRVGANFLRVLIQVSPPALTKGWPWYKIPPRQIHLDLSVLDEFDVSPYTQGNISLSVRKLTRDLEQLYVDELGRFDSAV
ncbi:lysophospholipid acyltransferase family protein [Paraglaciecola sp.]|uniref:lysophospholipid acyltransferase family protein n=1 Tax=Paraglaciecola sp. TaxID=1920173 RepID=UPI0030F3E017